eukprot:167997-Chlamydomonas_euryale.AAC.2
MHYMSLPRMLSTAPMRRSLWVGQCVGLLSFARGAVMSHHVPVRRSFTGAHQTRWCRCAAVLRMYPHACSPRAADAYKGVGASLLSNSHQCFRHAAFGASSRAEVHSTPRRHL